MPRNNLIRTCSTISSALWRHVLIVVLQDFLSEWGYTERSGERNKDLHKILCRAAQTQYNFACTWICSHGHQPISLIPEKFKEL